MTSSTERTERTERIRARLRVLAPADLKLRGAPRYQWARRATLVASWLVVVVVPLSHARLFERTSAGIFDAPTAAVLPLPDVLARSAIGSPTAIAIFGFELVDPLAALGVWLGGGGSWALVEVIDRKSVV